MDTTVITPTAKTSKPVWQSKTFWVAAITALAPLYPPVAAFVATNPTLVTVGLGVVFGVLRTVTKGAVTIS
jgi:hypothetical protein